MQAKSENKENEEIKNASSRPPCQNQLMAALPYSNIKRNISNKLSTHKLLLKKIKKDTIIVVGGPHVNALPIESIKGCQEIDYAIIGESEFSFANLCISLLSGCVNYNIPGLFFRNDIGEIVNQVEAVWDTNIDNLPYPAWDLFPKSDSYPVMWNRGCPFDCVFCSRNICKIINNNGVLKAHALSDTNRQFNCYE